MCSRPFRPASGGFAHLCRSRPRGSVQSLLPSQLYVDHSHCPRACASYLACVAVYSRDSRSRRVLCRSSHSLHSPKSRPISVRQRRNRKFAIAGRYSPTRVGSPFASSGQARCALRSKTDSFSQRLFVSERRSSKRERLTPPRP